MNTERRKDIPTINGREKEDPHRRKVGVIGEIIRRRLEDLLKRGGNLIGGPREEGRRFVEQLRKVFSPTKTEAKTKRDADRDKKEGRSDELHEMRKTLGLGGERTLAEIAQERRILRKEEVDSYLSIDEENLEARQTFEEMLEQGRKDIASAVDNLPYDWQKKQILAKRGSVFRHND